MCYTYVCIYIYIHIYIYTPGVPHKAVAEISKIGNLWEMLAVVNHGWQGESTDGPKGGWSRVLEWLQWLQWSPHPQLLDVAWCSAILVVVVMEL